MSYIANILVPIRTTRSGYGMAQMSDGYLRPLSKCCGVIMAADGMTKIVCLGVACTTDHYSESSSRHCSLENSVSPTLSHEILRDWVRKVLGDPEATITVV